MLMMISDIKRKNGKGEIKMDFVTNLSFFVLGAIMGVILMAVVVAGRED